MAPWRVPFSTRCSHVLPAAAGRDTSSIMCARHDEWAMTSCWSRWHLPSEPVHTAWPTGRVPSMDSESTTQQSHVDSVRLNHPSPGQRLGNWIPGPDVRAPAAPSRRDSDEPNTRAGHAPGSVAASPRPASRPASRALGTCRADGGHDGHVIAGVAGRRERFLLGKGAFQGGQT